MGEKIPQEIIIKEDVVHTPPCFGKHSTPQIKNSIPGAVELVLIEPTKNHPKQINSKKKLEETGKTA